MAHRNTLNELQVSVLRWIAQGCPPGVMDGDSHRISAAALRRRGLVTVSGGGLSWIAHVTAAGREYLERVEGDDPPLPRQPSVSVTQRLVDEVVAAGGSLRFPQRRWLERGMVDYTRRARMAQVHGKVPAGKRLVVHRASAEEVELALEDAPGYVAGRAEPEPLEFPERIGRLHAAARGFRDRKERHEVSQVALPRATRIVHILAVEAERRGWTAEYPTPAADHYGRSNWTATKYGHLAVTAGQELFWYRLQEGGVHTRGPWQDDVDRYRHVRGDESWWRGRVIPRGRYDAGADSRLSLELHCSRQWIFPGRQRHFADRIAWTLEDRLPLLLRELEERVVEAALHEDYARIAKERAAEEARRAAAERELRWQYLMEQARTVLIESDRAAELHRQASSWRTAALLRRYCDAAEVAHGADPDTSQWLAWAREHVRRLDPLTTRPCLPQPRDPTPEALQQFLPEGWSADGPDARRRQALSPNSW